MRRSRAMKPFVILYATREGQTRRIAEHIEQVIRERGHSTRVHDAQGLREPLDLTGCEGAVVLASVHVGKHEPEMVELVKRHRDALERLSASFVSVSLTEAGAEDASLPADQRAKAAADVQAMIDRFLAETGWRPGGVKAVAGALPYSKYNFILRFVMKQIAKKSSSATDTSRDYEFTDWKAVDAFVDALLAERAAHVETQELAAPV